MGILAEFSIFVTHLTTDSQRLYLFAATVMAQYLMLQ